MELKTLKDMPILDGKTLIKSARAWVEYLEESKKRALTPDELMRIADTKGWIRAFFNLEDKE